MKKFEDEYFLRPLNDIHFGNPCFDEEFFEKNISWIENNPYALTLGIGDNIENNNSFNERSLKTFDPEMLAKMGIKGLESDQLRTIRLYWKRLVEQDKVIGMHPGNHEDRTQYHDRFKLDFIDWFKTTCGKNVNYLGDKAFISLEFYHKKKPVAQYKILSLHGTFGGKTPYTVGNAAYNGYNAYEGFDLILFGHTHFTFANKHYRTYLDTSGEDPVPRKKKYYIVNTGTFLRDSIEGFDSYGDKYLSGAAREPGTATIRFTPHDNDLNAYT